MGTRIHKKLGYGLTDVQHEDDEITDSRINTASRLFSPLQDITREYLAHLADCMTAEAAACADSGERSMAYIDVAMEHQMLEASLESGKQPNRPVTCGIVGSPEILLVQPVGFPEWSRYDDPIDFFEEGELHQPIEPRVIPAPRGLYPFEGLYMDSRDGRELDSTAKRSIDRLLAAGEEKPDFRRAADHLARTLGFEDADQARTLMAPVVPSGALRVAAWGELFTSPEVCLQLRPMLYVYWA